MKIFISSGHGKHIRGAAGPAPWGLDEVNEARRVTERVAEYLRDAGVQAATFHDDTSHDQQTNLSTIVKAHNSSGAHDLDCSIHFNAYEKTETKKMGVECLYISQEDLAARVSAAMAAAANLPNRGAKYRGDLYFLNNTKEPAILVETLFCDAKPDCDSFRANFEDICRSLAQTIAGKAQAAPPAEAPVEVPGAAEALFKTSGKTSYFGGPDDKGVDADEGLAFFYDYDDAPHLFLEQQPKGTTGLARRLNVDRPYVACRWDYDVTPKDMLRQQYPALVIAPATGKQFLAWPADWGPHQDTGRIADISPSLMDRLGITTDDQVQVIYPAPLPTIANIKAAHAERKSKK